MIEQLQISMLVGAGLFALGWRPRRVDPGRRAVALLVAGNAIVAWGIYRYLVETGYVEHYLVCVWGVMR